MSTKAINEIRKGTGEISDSGEKTTKILFVKKYEMGIPSIKAITIACKNSFKI